jgi:hypothetical protein
MQCIAHECGVKRQDWGKASHKDRMIAIRRMRAYGNDWRAIGRVFSVSAEVVESYWERHELDWFLSLGKCEEGRLFLRNQVFLLRLARHHSAGPENAPDV